MAGNQNGLLIPATVTSVSAGVVKVTIDGADTAVVALCGLEVAVGSRVAVQRMQNQLVVVTMLGATYYEQANGDNFNLASGWQSLTWGVTTALGNQGSHMNGNAGTFTCPADGVYSFAATGYGSSPGTANSRIILQIDKGSTNLPMVRQEADFSGYGFPGLSAYVRAICTKNQVVYFRLYANGGLVGTAWTGEPVSVRLEMPA